MSKLQFNWPVIGHENIVNYLQQSLISQKITHAYLFFGPSNIGKTTVAEHFINSLICENFSKKSGPVPCQKCLHCQQMNQKTHADIYWLRREINDKTGEIKKNITIDQIRKLQNRLNTHSFLNSYKVAIILEAETLNQEANNSLLKTLEEPAPKTVILLLTSRLDHLPQTIISRCQVLKFLPVAKEKIFNYFLNNFKIERKEAKIFSNLALGRLGLALNFFTDNNTFLDYKEQVNYFLDLSNQNISQRFKAINSMVEVSSNNFIKTISSTQEILDIWLSILRDLILIKNSNPEIIANLFVLKKLKNIVERYSTKKVIDLIEKIKEAKKFLSTNVNPKLVLENLMLEL